MLIRRGFFLLVRFSTAMSVRDACDKIVATGRSSMAVLRETLPDFISVITPVFRIVFATMTRMLHHMMTLVFPRDFSVAR